MSLWFSAELVKQRHYCSFDTSDSDVKQDVFLIFHTDLLLFCTLCNVIIQPLLTKLTISSFIGHSCHGQSYTTASLLQNKDNPI